VILNENSFWWHDAAFYHIYPLGLSGAPYKNDFGKPIVDRFGALYPWLDEMQRLGSNALYLGPVFQSISHGYDTVDYYQVDRRLGDNASFARFAQIVHDRSIKLVLDGVFNHVGRDFWAFKDVLANGERSAYKDWFHNLRFDGKSPLGDPFTYEGWQSHYSLVKLNLAHPHVRDHLFDAVGMWMDRFGIDGLRMDAADCITFDFLKALRRFTKSRRSDFWLMGEVTHGDYKQWVNPETLDSVTNYECYKGLYSSLVESNYYEIAYGLNRQFGPEGIYRGLQLYNFVDNHDVDRVASKFKDPALLYPLYLLLFTMPGIPSVYYGSEFGIKAVKEQWSDAPLRPALDLRALENNSPQPELPDTIRRLAEIREQSSALLSGDYCELLVSHQQLAFTRQTEDEAVVVVLNSEPSTVEVDLQIPWQEGVLRDELNGSETFKVEKGHLRLPVPQTWGRILKLQNG
jgi:cyclomaltodextrinase / maltogenic alpha-amylase / neopullulanase